MGERVVKTSLAARDDDGTWSPARAPSQQNTHPTTPATREVPVPLFWSELIFLFLLKTYVGAGVWVHARKALPATGKTFRLKRGASLTKVAVSIVTKAVSVTQSSSHL